MKRIQALGIMKISLLVIIFVISYSALINVSYAQEDENSKPRIKIDVNKKYDDKGNIILYDSSYSYSWPDHGNNIDNDSLLENLHRHFELHNFNYDHFYPHSYVLPEFPNFDLEEFFRHADSALIWHDDLDTLLKRNFQDDFLNWNFEYRPFDYKSLDSIFHNLPFGFHRFPRIPDQHFQPFGPCDSINYWYDPFEERYPGIYFDDLDKGIEEMREYFERNYGSSPFNHDNFYRRDLKDRYRHKPKKKTSSVST